MLGEAVDTVPDKTKARAMLGSQPRALCKSVGISVDRYNEIAKMGLTNKSLAARSVKTNPGAPSVVSTVQTA